RIIKHDNVIAVVRVSEPWHQRNCGCQEKNSKPSHFHIQSSDPGLEVSLFYRTKKRFVHSRHRLLFSLVPVTKIRAPIPDAPAEILRFRRPPECRVKIRARLRV